ncbi:MAG: DUF1961 family protein [Lentisphaerae bacterium]|nr:DUF1961 family protein [Lentisphaerota bacterium]
MRPLTTTLARAGAALALAALAWPSTCLAQEPAMTLKTVAELQEFAKAAEAKHRAETGQVMLWGTPSPAPLIEARGPVLFTDDFADLAQWHHEGVGRLETPEPGVLQLNCVGSRQGREGCMAFCRKDFPDNIAIDYEMKALTRRGLLITFVAAAGREGEDMIQDLPPRTGIFADYILNPRLRCYHLSISRYNDAGEHTGVSNWRRNPGIFMMAQQPDPCQEIGRWYHVTIVKKGPLLQLAVDGKLVGGFTDPGEIPEPLPSAGKIGFRTIGADVRVQIRRVRVTALE